jgi:cbb3-type cytochrome oxidase maturation protein
MLTIFVLIFLSFCIGTGVWLFFIFSVKRGAFDDIEGAKYRMLDDDDDPIPAGKQDTMTDKKE